MKLPPQEKEKTRDAVKEALRIISRAERSAAQVRERLAAKGFSEGEIEEAVARLGDWGYLDDERFAALLARSRIENKNWGPARIARDLDRKGISGEIIDRVVAGMEGPRVLEAARRALSKWSRRTGVSTTALSGRDLERAWRHLLARGFSRQIVSRVIGEAGGNPPPGRDII